MHVASSSASGAGCSGRLGLRATVAIAVAVTATAGGLRAAAALAAGERRGSHRGWDLDATENRGGGFRAVNGEGGEASGRVVVDDGRSADASWDGGDRWLRSDELSAGSGSGVAGQASDDAVGVGLGQVEGGWVGVGVGAGDGLAVADLWNELRYCQTDLPCAGVDGGSYSSAIVGRRALGKSDSGHEGRGSDDRAHFGGSCG